MPSVAAGCDHDHGDDEQNRTDVNRTGIALTMSGSKIGTHRTGLAKHGLANSLKHSFGIGNSADPFFHCSDTTAESIIPGFSPTVIVIHNFDFSPLTHYCPLICARVGC